MLDLVLMKISWGCFFSTSSPAWVLTVQGPIIIPILTLQDKALLNLTESKISINFVFQIILTSNILLESVPDPKK